MWDALVIEWSVAASVVAGHHPVTRSEATNAPEGAATQQIW